MTIVSLSELDRIQKDELGWRCPITILRFWNRDAVEQHIGFMNEWNFNCCWQQLGNGLVQVQCMLAVETYKSIDASFTSPTSTVLLPRSSFRATGAPNQEPRHTSPSAPPPISSPLSISPNSIMVISTTQLALTNVFKHLGLHE